VSFSTCEDNYFFDYQYPERESFRFQVSEFRVCGFENLGFENFGLRK
jgi:hypothetical protein